MGIWKIKAGQPGQPGAIAARVTEVSFDGVQLGGIRRVVVDLECNSVARAFIELLPSEIDVELQPGDEVSQVQLTPAVEIAPGIGAPASREPVRVSLPWKKPKDEDDVDGKRGTIKVMSHALFVSEGPVTNGKARWRVFCETCSQLVTHSTVSAASQIRRHIYDTEHVDLTFVYAEEEKP